MGILSRLGLKKSEEKPLPSAGGKVVKVGPGDTLRKIAEREYGDPKQWERIYEANKWKIDDPEVLYPGMDLKIP